MHARLRPLLEACADGALPPNVALMQMMMTAPRESDIADALAGAVRASDGERAARLRRAEDLRRAHPQAFALVKDIVTRAVHDRPPDSAQASVRFWAAVYDRLARETPDAAVALYSLGSPDLLAQATAEVVRLLRDWRLVGPKRRVVEIGCGSGRFLRALARLSASVVGLDVSAAMLARARAQCADLSNVQFVHGSGHDLAPIADRSADLVLAADVFPLLVPARLAERYVAEAARVLAPGGHLAIFNFSYRGDPVRDAQEVRELFAAHGFAAERLGTRDLQWWDAAAFVGREAGARATAC